MTKMCPLCGRVAEFEDGVCSGCGAKGEPEARGPRVEYRRRRRAPVFLALGGVAALFGIVAMVGASGGEDPTSYTPASTASTPVWTPSADTSGDDHTDDSAADDAEAEDEVFDYGGKTYRCSEYVLPGLHAARAEALAEKREFRLRLKAVKRFDRNHPGRLTIAQYRQYTRLYKSAKAQLKVTDAAVDSFNGQLESSCSPTS